ncbi:uncharacterized protein LOC115224194 [Argonauta hians]
MNCVVIATHDMLPRLLLKPQTWSVSFRFAALSSSTVRATKTKAAPRPTGLQDLTQTPVKYSKSKAADWKSLDTFKTPETNKLKYEPIVVSVSLAVLLIYFAFLREENDLDLEMDKTLFQRIPALEKVHIQMQIKKDKKEGMDCTELEKRLKVVEAEIKRRQQV